MSNDILGQIVRKLVTLSPETHGVLIDLLTNLNDYQWVVATKRFLRKEQQWPVEIKLWERISDREIRVNLDACPKLPFDDAKIEWNKGSGWITVERRGDDLYVDDKKVLFHLVDGQKTGNVQGYGLCAQLKSQLTLHSNVLDALFENIKLIPESWKVDEYGRTRFIPFWAVGFCGLDGGLFVRVLYWRDNVWHHNHCWLGLRLDDRYPAAVLDS